MIASLISRAALNRLDIANSAANILALVLDFLFLFLIFTILSFSIPIALGLLIWAAVVRW